MDKAAQLTRTIQLFQDDLGIEDAEPVLHALTSLNVLLVADEGAMESFAGQVAITTSAILLARSGHRVFIDAPDAPLIGDQPPMSGSTFYEGIASVSEQIIDGVEIAVGCPLFEPQLAFVCGKHSLAESVRARRVLMVGWTDWSGEIADIPCGVMQAPTEWPMGAMAAATLVAAEAIKVAGRMLLTKATENSAHFADLFAPSARAVLRLAPEDTHKVSRLGRFDMVSAGAVANGCLYALFRLPGVSGGARVFDKDVSDQTNRNRNMLLIAKVLHLTKVGLFEHFQNGLKIEAVPRHFEESDLADLAPAMIVGVDDIPTRWLVAKSPPSWMSVGATSHFASMASVHLPTSGCAGCLHPYDEAQNGPIPTVAFVSFLAGLLSAADFVRNASGHDHRLSSRQRYLSALRVGGNFESGVPARADCPAECPASKLKSSFSG